MQSRDDGLSANSASRAASKLLPFGEDTIHGPATDEPVWPQLTNLKTANCVSIMTAGVLTGNLKMQHKTGRRRGSNLSIRQGQSEAVRWRSARTRLYN